MSLNIGGLSNAELLDEVFGEHDENIDAKKNIMREALRVAEEVARNSEYDFEEYTLDDNILEILSLPLNCILNDGMIVDVLDNDVDDDEFRVRVHINP